MKKINKDTQLNMRFTIEEKELLKKTASKHNLSVAMYIRVHFLNKILKKL